MDTRRIYSVGYNKLSESEKLDLCRLLIKAGYSVRLGRERKNGNSYAYFIEYWKD